MFVRKYEENGPLGRPRCRWEDDTRMNIKEKGWESVEQIYVAQCRDTWRGFVYTVMNFRFPLSAGILFIM